MVGQLINQFPLTLIHLSLSFFLQDYLSCIVLFFIICYPKEYYSLSLPKSTPIPIEDLKDLQRDGERDVWKRDQSL